MNRNLESEKVTAPRARATYRRNGVRLAAPPYGIDLADARRTPSQTQSGRSVSVNGLPQVDSGDQRQAAPNDICAAEPFAMGGSTDLRASASPGLASALGSTTIDSFMTNSSEIPNDGKNRLRECARHMLYFLRLDPASNVTIVGHADGVGGEERNIALGQLRADAVCLFLAGEGVPADRMTPSSQGESSPLVQVRGPEPRNRRVSVVFSMPAAPRPSGLAPSLSLRPEVPTASVAPAVDDAILGFAVKQREIEESDRDRQRKARSLGDRGVDALVGAMIRPFLGMFDMSDDFRKDLEQSIRNALEAGTEKACDAAIEGSSLDPEQQAAAKALCKAALKEKRVDIF